MPSASRFRRIIKYSLPAAAVLAGALWAGAWWHERQILSLFEGPEVNWPASLLAYRPGIQYDLTEYYGVEDLTTPADTSLTNVDARSSATRIYKVCIPTPYREPVEMSGLGIREPVEGAVFPPNLCAPNVTWVDAEDDLWLVRIEARGVRRQWLSRERTLTIPDEAWAEIVKSPGMPVRIEVRGIRRSGFAGKARPEVNVARLTCCVSFDPADPVVVYRLVDPPFLNVKTPNTYFREIAKREPKVLVDSRGKYCVNCHSFSNSSGTEGTLALQVRDIGSATSGSVSYLSFCDLAKGKGYRVSMPFPVQMTTFMAWSFDGTRIAFAANQDLASFAPFVLETQNTMQSESDIAVIDTRTWTARLVPGASEPGVIETFPSWTPDGSKIVFCSGPAKRPEPLTRFALRIVPAEGGVAKPIPNIPDDNASRVYPHFSADGLWLMFTQTAGGALVKPTSDLYIMPANFSEAPRKLECNSPYAADSWYSWSSNSRWIVFTSKRDDGIFARLYLAHIDTDGRASPPVRLPISDEPRMSFNIPEFVTSAPTVTDRQVFDSIDSSRPARPIPQPPVKHD